MQFPSHADFLSEEKTDFTLKDGENDISIKLDRVSELDIKGVQEQYSLFFTAPGESGLLQGIYTLSNSKLGEMEVFLVPVALDERGLRLQAVFSLISERSG